MPIRGTSPVITAGLSGAAGFRQTRLTCPSLQINDGQTLLTGVWTTVLLDQLTAYDNNGGMVVPSTGLYVVHLVVPWSENIAFGQTDTGNPFYYALAIDGAIAQGSGAGITSAHATSSQYNLPLVWLGVLNKGQKVQASLTCATGSTNHVIINTATLVRDMAEAYFSLTSYGPVP